MIQADIVAKLSDVLSDRAIDLLTHEAPYSALVVGPATPTDVDRKLGALKPADLLRKPVVKADEAAAVLAGVWIFHDRLDPAHEIVQDIHTPTGSLWHAIIHRRQGDFWNSKYWYAKARAHGSHVSMANVIAAVLNRTGAMDNLGKVMDGGSWVPDRFVDLVQAAHSTSDDHRREALAQIQFAEWQTVFEHTARAAV